MRYIKTYEQYTQSKQSINTSQLNEKVGRHSDNGKVYFISRIGLNDLNKVNKKLEYRALQNELEAIGFYDYYGEGDYESKLPNGTYAALHSSESLDQVFDKAENAIKKALKPYYPVDWTDKYTITVSGPSRVISRNLKSVK